MLPGHRHQAAAETRAAVFTLTVADLTKSEIGESERTLSKTFALAAQSKPAVIILDDVHVLFGSRGDVEGGVGKLIITQLLLEVDRAEPGVAVIATTTVPELVEPALLRPGRIDQAVQVTLPDAAARDEIVGYFCAELALAPDVRVADIATSTDGLSCADVASLVRKAVFCALKRQWKPESPEGAGLVTVEHADFERAAAATTRSTPEGRESELSAWRL